MNREQFRADIATVIENVPVDESLVSFWAREIAVLIKKKVSQPKVQERILVELHTMGLVRLAAADDVGASLGHINEILLKLRSYCI